MVELIWSIIKRHELTHNYPFSALGQAIDDLRAELLLAITNFDNPVARKGNLALLGDLR